MLVVGLTGGIGSGKSTVAEIFSGFGVPVIDTDAISHQLTVPGGEALGAIRDAFGDAVMRDDGSLDRVALRRRVFADDAARRQLEAVMHPRIRRRVEQALVALSAPYALIVIPLLVETGGYRDLLNRVLVVDCPEDTQIERVMARGLSRDEAVAVLAAQASRAERLAAADDVILNTASIDALPPLVAQLHQRYQTLVNVVSP